jgi:hypothetical protein
MNGFYIFKKINTINVNIIKFNLTLGILKELIVYASRLKNGQSPDYDYCISKVAKKMKMEGVRMDWQMDWT